MPNTPCRFDPRRFSVYAALTLVTSSGIVATAYALHKERTIPEAQALPSLSADISTRSDTPMSGAVEQLRRRLASAGYPVPPGAALERALDEKRALLSRVTTLTVMSDGKAVAAERIALYEHADWLTLRTTAFSASYDIDATLVGQALSEQMSSRLGSGSAVEASQLERHDTAQILGRASLPMRPSEGYSVDWTAAAAVVTRALKDGESAVAVEATHEPATVVVRDASGATFTLTLLSVGRSNFAHSPWGREVNIRKGLGERINGTFVPQGAEFSFNDAIGPMSSSRGWKEALGIFEGVNLKPIVGGGICQVATTVYRAALLAGLPVEERKNHSLYVTYYKEYGVGLDATVFPGKQDLAFINDTAGPLFIESWTTDDDDAFVRMYGMSDGRSVALDGPYYGATAPETLLVTDSKGARRAVRKNEIAWERVVVGADGTERRETIVSTYNAVPKSLVAAALAEQEVMHAAAPPESSL